MIDGNEEGVGIAVGGIVGTSDGVVDGLLGSTVGTSEGPLRSTVGDPDGQYDGIILGLVV